MKEDEMVTCDLCGKPIKKDDAVDDQCGNYYCLWCVKYDKVFGDAYIEENKEIFKNV